MNQVTYFSRACIGTCFDEMTKFLKENQVNPVSVAMAITPHEADCHIILVYEPGPDLPAPITRRPGFM